MVLLHTQDLAWLDECSSLACDTHTVQYLWYYNDMKILDYSYITVGVAYISYSVLHKAECYYQG